MLEELFDEVGDESDLSEIRWRDLLDEPREERPVIQKRLGEEAPNEGAAAGGKFTQGGSDSARDY